jgi:hypothetical protein
MSDIRYLWQFAWYFRRGGEVESLFVATEKEVENLIGEYVYFGEIMGKHSEVCGNIEEGDITKLDVSPEAVEEVAKHLGGTWSGYDPRDYVRYECAYCGDRFSRDECDFFEEEEGLMCGYCKDNKEDDN